MGSPRTCISIIMAAMLGCAQSYHHQITTAARNLQGRHPHDRLRKQHPPKSLVAAPNRSSFAKICPAMAQHLGAQSLSAANRRNDQPIYRRGNANSQLRRGFAFPLPQSTEVWCKGSGTEMHLSSTFRRDSTSLINSSNRFAKCPF